MSDSTIAVFQYVLKDKGEIAMERDASSRTWIFSRRGKNPLSVEHLLMKDEQLDSFPLRVRGLDWDVFAATLRAPEWVVRMMYEQVEKLQ